MNPNFPAGSVFGARSVQSDRSVKILLVDDEPEILAATSQLLVWSGFAVTAVSSAEHAMAELETNSFDLVVTDFRLGGKQGDAVAIAARNTRPETPVVLVTGLVDELPEWMHFGESALPIVAKPFRMPELLAAMKRALAEADTQLTILG